MLKYYDCEILYHLGKDDVFVDVLSKKKAKTSLCYMFEDDWGYPATRYDQEGNWDYKGTMETLALIRMEVGAEEEMQAHYPELFENGISRMKFL